jgi:hypothetical protein
MAKPPSSSKIGGFVADLNRDQLQRLAALGALARLEELRREEAAIRQAFPDLFGGRGRSGRRGAAGAQKASAGRRRRRMSAAARKAVSERMRKYWADRRKAKGGKSK